MAKQSIIGKLYMFFRREKLPPGYYLIMADPKYDAAIKKHTEIIEKKEETKGHTINSLISIETNYSGRTLDQNALMWSLYEIEVNEHNQGQLGSHEYMVTKEELYIADLLDWGHWEYVTFPLEKYNYWKTQFKIFQEVSKDSVYWHYKGIRGSSQYTTMEMARHIEGIFNRLIYNGLDIYSPEKIEKYWREWNQYLCDSKILLRDKLMSIDEYRGEVTICEICGKPLYPGTDEYCGNVHHIKAVGMGADRNMEEKKQLPYNWLALCQSCHTRCHSIGGGMEWIKKTAPWLKYKIGKANRGKYRR